MVASAALIAAAVPVRVTLALPLSLTMPAGVPTVMVPWLTVSTMVRMSVVLGLSDTVMVASEMAEFSLPLSASGALSVTVTSLTVTFWAVSVAGLTATSDRFAVTV